MKNFPDQELILSSYYKDRARFWFKNALLPIVKEGISNEKKQDVSCSSESKFFITSLFGSAVAENSAKHLIN